MPQEITQEQTGSCCKDRNSHSCNKNLYFYTYSLQLNQLNILEPHRDPREKRADQSQPHENH